MGLHNAGIHHTLQPRFWPSPPLSGQCHLQPPAATDTHLKTYSNLSINGRTHLARWATTWATSPTWWDRSVRPLAKTRRPSRTSTCPFKRSVPAGIWPLRTFPNCIQRWPYAWKTFSPPLSESLTTFWNSTGVFFRGGTGPPIKGLWSFQQKRQHYWLPRLCHGDYHQIVTDTLLAPQSGAHRRGAFRDPIQPIPSIHPIHLKGK